MSTPTPPSAPDDARDPQVLAWLAVDPLDDVTRARLVRDALAGSGAPPAEAGRRRPLAAVLAVAAVLVALAVVSMAVLTSRGTDSTTTAVDAPRSKSAPESSRQGGDSATDSAPSEALAPAGDPTGTVLVLPDLGDLGDVSTGSRLEAAVSGRLPVPAGTATTTVSGCASDAGRAFGTPVAAGTGVINGRRATVVVATSTAGSTAAVATRGRSCAEGVSVILP